MVSLEGEARGVFSRYSDILSSSRLDVEEAVEVGGGEARVMAGEGGVLPRVEGAVDHLAFLVSDRSVIPPRKEVRVVIESTDPKEDIANLSKLVRLYSERAQLRALGVLVCDKVTDEMMTCVQGLEDVEVVCITREALERV